MVTGSDWLSRLPLITTMPPGEAAAKLRDIGEDDMADALAEATQDAPETFGWVPHFGAGSGEWLSRAHTIGYLAPVDGPASEPLPIRHAANIRPDDTLNGARIKLTLDELRVADYPGHGRHDILFSFSASNQTERGDSQELHFSTHYDVADGQRGAIQGRPIFVGLKVGGEGIHLKCATVNVANDDDEKLLKFLDGDAFQAGLQLLTTAQPALAPFSALAVGLTETIAKRSRNVPVQTVDLGLDFSSIAPRPRLAQGSYIAVQIPGGLRTDWHWDEWVFNPLSGDIVNLNQPGMLIPYNYFIISVSRHNGS
jgi:hypothetical protein